MQSSWTKQAVEVDSHRLTSPVAQLAEWPDSTCAQDIHSNAETLVDKWVPTNAIRKCLEQEEQLGMLENLLLCGSYLLL